MPDSDDLRHFLATARAGSTLGGARLRVTPPEAPANLVLNPFLLGFRQAHPDVRVDLIVLD